MVSNKLEDISGFPKLILIDSFISKTLLSVNYNALYLEHNISILSIISKVS